MFCKTYTTDPTGIANNEDSYTMHANADKMQNDRVLGNILLTKVDLDAARYLAAGSNGDTTLEGAVYDLYAADTIEHPDGVSGIVDYSKITDANGTPIWHTTVLTNGSWDTDYLPILQKDRLIASAKITDGKLAFANLYMGRYYLVERATGLVLPIDGNGKLYVTGKYPQLNKKLERTGKYSDLARKNGTTTIHYSNDDVLIYERKFYDDVILVAINRQPDKAYTIDNVETLLPEGEYVDFLGGMLNGENISVYASTGINTMASITLDGGEVGVWQYDAAASAPEIGNVVSTMGRAGNRVYIYGDGLDGNISVKFGETEATVESNTANEIVTYVPDNAVAGYNDITVTKGDAVSNSFT